VSKFVSEHVSGESDQAALMGPRPDGPVLFDLQRKRHSANHIEGLVGWIVFGLGFGGWDMSDWAGKAMVVESVAPAQGGHFHC